MKHFAFLILFSLSFSVFAQLQVAPNKYYFELTDKNHNLYSLDLPEEFLSERALQRRAVQNIFIDYSDLPVSQFYIDSIKTFGVEILNVSKWFNSVLVYSETFEAIEAIKNLSFVNNTIKHEIYKDNKRAVDPKYNVLRKVNKGSKSENYYDYGPSSDQIFMHNGQILHNNGFRGQGMLIAVTDAGFSGLPNLPSLESLFSDNRVVATKNFVDGSNFVFNYSTHGMRVLSILAGNFPGNLIGSAPEASYVLLMSEDPNSENLIEEINWVAAAEFADSIGADLINVSLGYLNFDMTENSHTYQDMDGETTIISLAARQAAQKGILVVVAAANSGADETHPWIASPGDAKDVVTAGAVWANGSYASFSSIGPSFDGRVKPELMAMGGDTYNQEISGDFGYGSGTSFAAPLLTGMFACLWQQFPEKTNFEIIEVAKLAANNYTNPNQYMGYGIPDFNLASQILLLGNKEYNIKDLSINPNPFNSYFEINLENVAGDKVLITITDSLGRKNFFWNELITSQDNQKVVIKDLAILKTGVYIVNVSFNSKRYTAKLIKE